MQEVLLYSLLQNSQFPFPLKFSTLTCVSTIVNEWERYNSFSPRFFFHDNLWICQKVHHESKMERKNLIFKLKSITFWILTSTSFSLTLFSHYSIWICVNNIHRNSWSLKSDKKKCSTIWELNPRLDWRWMEK